MSWWHRQFAAWLAALTSLALLLTLANAIPKKSKGVSVLVAINRTDGNCGDGPATMIIDVTPTGLLLNGQKAPALEIENYLRAAMRNRMRRLVYVDGNPAARFADVADVFSMLHGLQIEAVMLMPGVDRNKCFMPYLSESSLDPRPQPNPAVQPVSWWRFW